MCVGTLTFEDLHGTSHEGNPVSSARGAPQPGQQAGLLPPLSSATQTALCHGNTLNSRNSMFFAWAPVVYQVINTNLPWPHVNNGWQLDYSQLHKENEPNQPWYQNRRKLVLVNTRSVKLSPKTDSIEDAKDKFPKIWKEWLVLPPLVAEGKYSRDWINKTATFIMLRLKALQGRHWLIRLLLLILFSLSRRTTCAEVWHTLCLNCEQVGEVPLFQILTSVSGANWYADRFQDFECDCLH